MALPLLRFARRAPLEILYNVLQTVRGMTDLGQRAFIRHLLADDESKDDQRIIASLTTLPDRIATIKPTIDSLLQQTRVPDEIVVVVPEFSLRQQRRYDIPEFLAAMPRVRILRTEKDSGPATKFIPIIQEEKAAGRNDTLIMVADDDRTYPRDSVALYRYYSRRLPDAAFCFRGGAMPRGRQWHHVKIIFGNNIREPQRVAVMSGCGSYLIRPRFFDESLWDYAGAPRGAFYMDDIWIAGCLDRRGVKKYVIPSAQMMRTVIRQTATMNLYEVPKGRRASNNDTIAFFEKTWNVFPPD
ncbi:MAG: glycosyltransferase family A protein [Verrucomicrobiota bacterium]